MPKLSKERKAQLKEMVLSEISSHSASKDKKALPKTKVGSISDEKKVVTSKTQIDKSLANKSKANSSVALKTNNPKLNKKTFKKSAKSVKAVKKINQKTAPLQQSWPPKASNVKPKSPAKKKSVKVTADQQKVEPKINAPADQSGVKLIGSQRGIKQYHPASTLDRQKSIRMMVIIVLIASILFALINVFGLYRLGWQNNASQLFAQSLSLPAGYALNTDTGEKYYISLSEYLSDIKVLDQAIKNDREGANPYVTEANFFRHQVFDRLINIKLAEMELRRYGSSVSSADLDSAMAQLTAELQGEMQINQMIEDLYGLNLEQFKIRVLKPILIKDRLQKFIIQDNESEFSQRIKSKALAILQATLEVDVDFEQLANQFTEDEAGINTGGDLGWVSRGQLEPQLEQIVFNSDKNSVSSQLGVSGAGYHIIKVGEKLIDEESGQESVRVNHILIKVDVDKYLLELKKKVKIVNYVSF